MCPVIADSVLMCSKNTSMDPVMVMVIENTLVIAGQSVLVCVDGYGLTVELEKTIGVRKWQGN